MASVVSVQVSGLCPTRLQRIDARLNADIDRGLVPGAVAIVARHGRIAYRKALGFRDRAAGSAMPLDAIFWIASMTKPVVATAAMILAESARLNLSHPVSAYLPAFRHMKLRHAAPPGGANAWIDVPCTREMTVQDLLRHTSGLTYGFMGDSPVHRAYQEARTFDYSSTNEEIARRLSELPLASEPGTVFEYGMSIDVLGRIIEVVSGEPLDRFIAEQIATPLGLTSLAFGVPPAQHGRIARALAGEELAITPPPFPSPAWKSGGAGLWSTADDYYRFAQMLLNGGELDGVRLLSPQTVRHMTSNHLPPDVQFGAYVDAMGATAPTPWMGHGFGLGVVVRTEAGRNPLPGTHGDFGWPGISGATFWVDPLQGLVVVLMIHSPSRRLEYRAVMRQLVYQALVD